MWPAPGWFPRAIRVGASNVVPHADDAVEDVHEAGVVTVPKLLSMAPPPPPRTLAAELYASILALPFSP